MPVARAASNDGVAITSVLPGPELATLRDRAGDASTKHDVKQHNSVTYHPRDTYTHAQAHTHTHIDIYVKNTFLYYLAHLFAV